MNDDLSSAAKPAFKAAQCFQHCRHSDHHNAEQTSLAKLHFAVHVMHDKENTSKSAMEKLLSPSQEEIEELKA